MPSEGNYATSETDFYALLGVHPEASQRSLDSAWRKFALKNHPDKVGNDLAKQELFSLGQIGHALLSDPATRATYDSTRTARNLRKRQNELYEGKRREMKDDLEARERGFKRARTEEEDNEEKLERELRRLAEDGKRRRKEREDALKQDVQREAEQNHSEPHGSPASGGRNQTNGTVNQQIGVSDLDRTIRVVWPRDGPGESLSQEQIVKTFSTFGEVESAHMLNPKMLRIGEKNKKKLAQVCMVTFRSIVGSHAAIEDFPKMQGPQREICSVTWASKKSPDLFNGYQSSGNDSGSAPSTPAPKGSKTSGTAFLSMDEKSSTPTDGEDLRKMPSFSSFSSTPKGSPFGRNLGVNSPSLEEITMIRLKNAEKKRLADEIQRQDDEASAAAAKGEEGQL